MFEQSTEHMWVYALSNKMIVTNFEQTKSIMKLKIENQFDFDREKRELPNNSWSIRSNKRFIVRTYKKSAKKEFFYVVLKVHRK